MLNSGVTRLRAHRPLEPANLKPARHHQPTFELMKGTDFYRKASTLQPERDQVQEVDKLAEHDALRGRVLIAQIAQLFYERFYFRTRSPRIDVQTAKDALARGGGQFQLQGRCLEINCEGEMTNRASRLRRGAVSAGQNKYKIMILTCASIDACRYCLMHSRSNI